MQTGEHCDARWVRGVAATGERRHELIDLFCGAMHFGGFAIGKQRVCLIEDVDADRLFGHGEVFILPYEKKSAARLSSFYDEAGRRKLKNELVQLIYVAQQPFETASDLLAFRFERDNLFAH